MPGPTQQHLSAFFLSRKIRRLKKRNGRRRKKVKEVNKRKKKKLNG
jgi:hypothetical protein